MNYGRTACETRWSWKSIDWSKAKTAEAKATLETEIAKLEALKLRKRRKHLKEDYTRVFEAYQKLVKNKTIGKAIRLEQDSIKHEEETRRNEPVRHESTENKVMKTTIPTVM